jgi:hypothetical protein
LLHASSGVDGGETQLGIMFNLLDHGNDPTLSCVSTSHQVAPELLGTHTSTIIDEFMETHGFKYAELNPRVVDLADLCIGLAQAA